MFHPPVPQPRYHRPGQSMLATVNAYELSWSAESKVYHYDVVITPRWRSNRPVQIGQNKGLELVTRLMTVVEPNVFVKLGAFDGKRNLFSFEDYKIQSREFPRVPWESDGGHRFVSIKVSLVRTVDVNVLRALFGGSRRNDTAVLQSSSEASATLNMLNLYVHAQPRLQHLHKGNSFYVKAARSPRESSRSKIQPLELWPGLFQSVRLGFDRILLNVDVTMGVVMPEGTLENISMKFLNIYNARELGRQTNHFKLRSFLRGVKVQVTLNSHRGRKSKMIKDIIRNVGDEEFERDGRMVTVAEHFQQIHGTPIPTGSLGVKLGKGELFPFQCCHVPQQLYKTRLGPDGVTEMLALAPADPRARFAAIQRGWNDLGHHASSFLAGANISISQNPLTVKGRILPSPTIQFGPAIFKENPPRFPEPTILSEAGKWDVQQRILAKPARIRHIVVFNLTGRPGREVFDFVEDLFDAMRQRGIEIWKTYPTIDVNPQNDIAQVLGGHLYRTLYNPELNDYLFQTLVIAILPEHAAELYTSVKRLGDITLGVATQCICWSPKITRNYSKRQCNQRHNNIILKINVRMGGINYWPCGHAMTELKRLRTMVIGADISHPAPNSSLPSVASVVASYDPHACQYVTRTALQPARLEVIENLKNMVDDLLRHFYKANGDKLPARIIIFRDGVSEGEFARVKSLEEAVIHEVVRSIYSKPPTVLFVIVGKRHHFRFMPQGRADRSGNCTSGFVVDQEITSPLYSDFFLQSQPGLKGTSIPSHYTVLAKKNSDSDLQLNFPECPKDVAQEDWNLDVIEQLAYALCHCYSRATRAVKIPAPVYYADLICSRAKFHYEPDLDVSDVMSSDTSESAELTFQAFKAGFASIHKNLAKTMYWV
ncbi:ribonuclease H-like domain-containing protein [Mycena floridula]|nr:ribonuclease H-like domain-containing protein [Mycena floridula]